MQVVSKSDVANRMLIDSPYLVRVPDKDWTNGLADGQMARVPAAGGTLRVQ